jgi:hypothetical protein
MFFQNATTNRSARADMIMYYCDILRIAGHKGIQVILFDRTRKVKHELETPENLEIIPVKGVINKYYKRQIEASERAAAEEKNKRWHG